MSSGPHAPDSINWDLSGLADDVLAEFNDRFALAVDHGADKVIFHYNGCEWNFESRRKASRTDVSGQISQESLSWHDFDLSGIEVVVDLASAEPLIDGYFDFDPADPDDTGGIRVYLSVTECSIDTVRIARQVRATLVHELYHAGCRSSKPIDYTGGLLSFEDHLTDSEEIGARVEEAMALMAVDENPAHVRLFEKTLCSLIECYLTRNGVALDDARFESLSSEMFKSHMTEYRCVMGFFG